MTRFAAISIAVASFIQCAQAEPLTSNQQQQIALSLARFKSARPDVWMFSIFTDSTSNKFVQFAAKHGSVEFDFPLYASHIPNVQPPLKDTECGPTPSLPVPGEVFAHQMSTDEEDRLVKVLSANGYTWTRRFCTAVAQSGVSAGHTASLVGRTNDVGRAVRLVDLVFKEVYGLKKIDKLEVETEQ